MACEKECMAKCQSVGLSLGDLDAWAVKLAGFLESDGAVMLDFVRTGIKLISAYSTKDWAGIITNLGQAGADLRQIAADIRALVAS